MKEKERDTGKELWLSPQFIYRMCIDVVGVVIGLKSTGEN